MLDKITDKERLSDYFIDEIYHYPRFSEAEDAYYKLREERNRIWKEGKWWMEFLVKLKILKNRGVIKNIKSKAKRKTSKGRWGANIKKF